MYDSKNYRFIEIKYYGFHFGIDWEKVNGNKEYRLVVFGNTPGEDDSENIRNDYFTNLGVSKEAKRIYESNNNKTHSGYWKVDFSMFGL